jgi:hypothetical protein
VVRAFVDIEELVGAATEVEKVLGELRETPYEPLREEQEKETSKSNVEKQVTALNSTLINFFKKNAHNPASSSFSIVFGGCQICRVEDHMATTCPRLNEARPKYAKCNMPHRTENCGIKCTYCAGLGHFEDKCWKKPNDGKSHFGAANFVEVLLYDEEATTTVEDKILEQQHVEELVEATKGIGIVTGKKSEDAVTPYEEPRVELSDTKEEHVDAVEDKISA